MENYRGKRRRDLTGGVVDEMWQEGELECCGIGGWRGGDGWTGKR